ncbi:hypothetical protein P3631_23940 [Vibrio parahaemolyticus]|uniref:hypothetical protein n=1 Tax=Vibrio TaxID=662 RepID=UPI001122D71E|nr:MULTISPECIES: hypothetical protein [Vibrio]MCR9666543.1 hypothetical protein [Vibrio parahaemolyticus]MCR9678694.1 hypothetical protein [Vibrio parahaemolyticus]MDF4990527.1 hypothetical protein [Vibrio parahaemolyticus]MDF5093993.1 hypothetical protein [Vibrio parahaemolyticus]MDF5138969.1 hypothetical protein [Vibrio parahaemolyticus]
MENFIQLIAAFGIGGLIVKLIDIFILQPYLVKKELNKWLREKKLEAYSLAVEDITAMGFKNTEESPFENLGNLSRTLLLVEDPKLQKLIESHIFDRANLHDCESDSPNQNELFSKVHSDAQKIILALKNDLREGA